VAALRGTIKAAQDNALDNRNVEAVCTTKRMIYALDGPTGFRVLIGDLKTDLHLAAQVHNGEEVPF
jgi:hypothetical protein